MAATTEAIGPKKDAPASDRNKGVIWETLSTKIFPNLVTGDEKDGAKPLNILEVAGGTGIHTAYFGRQLCQTADVLFGTATNTKVQWFPTDPDSTSLASQRAYIAEETPLLDSIVQPPMHLTLDSDGVQEATTKQVLDKVERLQLIVCINMVHISPWTATEGLMKEAGRRLAPGGYLYLYGPYRVNGTCTESNVKFEGWLHSLDPGYGLRNLEDVTALAEQNGLQFQETVEMPANNLSVIYRKAA